MPKNKNYLGIMLRLRTSGTKNSSQEGFPLQTQLAQVFFCRGAVKEAILLEILSFEFESLVVRICKRLHLVCIWSVRSAHKNTKKLRLKTSVSES